MPVLFYFISRHLAIRHQICKFFIKVFASSSDYISEGQRKEGFMAVTSTVGGSTSISGLISGFDWRSMIDQLIAVDHNRVDLVTQKQTVNESKLAAWQSFNSKLLALKTAAGNLRSDTSFEVFKATLSSSDTDVQASDLLSVATSSGATPGSYDLKITNIAQAQKLSSGSFASASTALGSTYAGDVLINGQIVNITAADTLTNIRDKINALNTGSTPTKVSAGIINYGASDYRLVLTSQQTGADGIALLNGSENDILGNLGITETAATTYSLKNAVTGGTQSDRFSGVSETIAQLLSLNAAASSTTLQIRDSTGTLSNMISIDLAAMDLNDIRDAINNSKGTANIAASVKTEVVSGTTYYRLQVDGLNAADPFKDSKNIFQTLGFTKGAVGDVLGATGSNAITTGGAIIEATTLLSEIDGYLNWTTGDHIDFSGKDTANADVVQEFAITETSTVQDLLTAIEAAYGNVDATITGDGKILISDLTKNRPSNLNVTMADTITDGSRLDFGFSGSAAGTVRKREITAGADALLSIDGVSVTRTSNSITDVINGVLLNLRKGDAGTTVTVHVDQDLDAIAGKISALVSAYNDVASDIKTQQAYDTEKKKVGGILFGDGTLSSIKTDLTSTLISSVWGVASDLPSLGLIGINLDNDGQLTIDQTILNNNLQTRFNDVQALFSIKPYISATSLEYADAGRLTQAGDYAVNITQAATQSSLTSPTAVGGTLGSGETMTITENGKTATVSLTAGMSMADIVNALNTEVNASYSQILAGGESLYSDAGHSAKITANTTWNSVYNSAGASANLVNGDVIAFSGTGRSGETMQGSYRITNAATDTVQGLLSAIEQAYGNTVSARISSDGQVTVADRQTGNSSLAISFSMASAHDLNFGPVNETNTGGTKGRFSLAVAASADGSNKLVLTHHDYGSVNSFTVSESADLLWPTGDQTANNGKDVAGTIDGKTATGVGQTLTGSSGQTGIEGLVLKYTGTTTGAIGSIKLTMGIGELFDRALYQITDTVSGYLAYKTTSIQGEIDAQTTQIDEMEARLSLKKERLTYQFIAMETALSKIKNQGDWLTSMIAGL
jgi:flagellar hook-associated protein 2